MTYSDGWYESGFSIYKLKVIERVLPDYYLVQVLDGCKLHKGQWMEANITNKNIRLYLNVMPYIGPVEWSREEARGVLMLQAKLKEWE